VQSVVKIRLSCSEKQNELVLILLLCAIGIILRIILFGKIPPGLNQDEVASGYEAYSLLLTGKDKWGNVFPAYFIAWGGGQNVLYSYLSIPIIYIFGLNVLSVRAINLIFGILSIPLFYQFIKNTVDQKTAYLATFLIAVSPWHIMLSRWGLESNLLPFFTLLGFYTVHQALTSHAFFRKIIFSLIPWGIALYAYGTFYFILSVAIILIFREYKSTILKNKRSWIVAVLLFLSISFPVILFVLKNSIFRGGLIFEKYLPFSIPLLTSIPFRSINPQTNLEFILNGFQDDKIWNSIPSIPPLYMIFFPFLCVGAVITKHDRSGFPGANLSLIWLLSFIPMFFISSLNVNRANSIFMPSLIIALIGFEAVLKALRTRFIKKIFSRVIITWVLVGNFLFLTNYFFFYSPKVYEAFNYGLDSALNVAKNQSKRSEKILITNQINLAYVYTLFLDRYDPAKFQSSSQYFLDEDGIYNVQSFGRFYFDKDSLNLSSNESFIFLQKNKEEDACQASDILHSQSGWKVGRCFG
jgi:4-amino-4-deoxy-L-arabinose transferase-like glycosyltransferase